MKKVLKCLFWIALILALGVGGILLFCIISAKVEEGFKSTGNAGTIALAGIFAIVFLAEDVYLVTMFCSSVMAMLFPGKYNPVEVEIVAVEYYRKKYSGRWYYPIVKRVNDKSDPPRTATPKMSRDYRQKEAEKLVGTSLTLYARDRAPYDLYDKGRLKKSNCVFWTLWYGGFMILFIFAFICMICVIIACRVLK